MRASSAALNNALWLICLYSSAGVCQVLGQYWKGHFIPLYLFLSYYLLHEKGSLIFELPFS